MTNTRSHPPTDEGYLKRLEVLWERASRALGILMVGPASLQMARELDIKIADEQHVYAVEQLDAGAFGYLVSRTALLHPKGETFDVSMGLGELVRALTKIAAQPDKDFGDLVRQRRRKRGLPVAQVGKVLPFLPASFNDNPAERATLDKALVALLCDDASEDACAVRLRLAERRMGEALLALDQAVLGRPQLSTLARLEATYAHELAAYKRLEGRSKVPLPAPDAPLSPS